MQKGVFKGYKEGGQISLFLAFIFPILFVFFAMTINIGLVVHDKINLQNSVDLAAYYGAAKQAEVLNAIAHINYQMRQSWKLLAFRVRGFGDMGRGRIRTTPTPSIQHPWVDRSVPGLVEADFNTDPSKPPAVCGSIIPFWHERFANDIISQHDKGEDNPCVNPDRATTFPYVPKPILLLGSGINQLTEQLAQQIKDLAGIVCERNGPSNWTLGTRWLLSYQYDVQQKRSAIEYLAEKLEKGKDLTGVDIEEGIRKTLENNLTRSNRDAFDTNTPNFKFLNSMEGIDIKEWLVVRGLYPVIYYVDSEKISSSGCKFDLKALNEKPSNLPPNPDVNRILGSIAFPDPISIKDFRNPYPAIGYEKNPWHMVYTGVSVTTRPEEPFAPLSGYRPSLKAKAFAKPFGGKIGPWMYPSWLRDQPQSTGASDQQIDSLLPLSIEGETDPSRINPANLTDLNKYVPNYSRYPGDELGLRSSKALSIYKDIFNNLPLRILQQPILAYDYFNLDFSISDRLMWNDNLNVPPPARMLEVLAVAPDLFDITYYSIDPQFYLNYIAFIEGSFFRTYRFVRDFGARINSPDPSYREPFGVFDQIHWANNGTTLNPALFPPPLPSLAPLQGEWIVKRWEHLLTGWVPDMDRGLFGRCNNDEEVVARRPAEAFPSSCALGGRTGYSVKLVSKKYLESPDLELGGPAGGAGSILSNSIPNDF